MAGGGSTITVPLLVFAGVPGTYANGSNRVGILPACLAAILSFRRLGISGFRDFRIIFLPVLYFDSHRLEQRLERIFLLRFGGVAFAFEDR